jgi:hypothetical protein
MTREGLQWVLQRATGIQVPLEHILVHVKSNGPAAHGVLPQSPCATGCSSVFVPAEQAEALVQWNQRLFCNATTLYMADSKDRMTALLGQRTVLDQDPLKKDGVLRGPKNAMVIEQAHQKRGALRGYGAYYRQPYYMLQSWAGHWMPETLEDAETAAGDVDPALDEAPTLIPSPAALSDEPEAAAAATDDADKKDQQIFLGGIRYEATEGYIAWMLNAAVAHVFPTEAPAAITAHDVSLFPNHRPAAASGRGARGNAGCAYVAVSQRAKELLTQLHKRLLCAAAGIYIAKSEAQMSRFIVAQRNAGELGRTPGPSHAVVIEAKRDDLIGRGYDWWRDGFGPFDMSSFYCFDSAYSFMSDAMEGGEPYSTTAADGTPYASTEGTRPKKLNCEAPAFYPKPRDSTA